MWLNSIRQVLKTGLTGALVLVLSSLFAAQADAGDQPILEISNDMTADIVRVSVNTDHEGAISTLDIAGQKFDLGSLHKGAKLVYKEIFLMTAKAVEIDPVKGGTIDLICNSGAKKKLRLQLKKDSNGRWAVYAKGKTVHELRLVIELNWRLKATGAKDIQLASLPPDPNQLLASLVAPFEQGSERVSDVDVKPVRAAASHVQSMPGVGGIRIAL